MERKKNFFKLKSDKKVEQIYIYIFNRDVILEYTIKYSIST